MEVQQSLLPKGPPKFPGFDIQGKAAYCDETGGDYYDFLLFERDGDTKLAIAMGDVTGHGIAAALLMTTARALVRARADAPGSLAQHITRINSLLSADNDHGRFLTLFFMVMDRERAEMRYVAAGHDPAIIYAPATDSFRELDAEGGIPLGIDASWEYLEHSAPMLAPGEVMFLGTDGIWEARDTNDVLYGKERMKEVIRANAARTSAEICDAVLEAVRAYRGTVPQLDDITMVVVKAV
jgi:sigma-B regulation protein RsbU (phosphoserine phosphatase)